MLKYLIIMLDDTSVSFCHYTNSRTERGLISTEHLSKAITWAMKENVNVQFVYPDYDLPEDYIRLIDTVDHVDIRPSRDKRAVEINNPDDKELTLAMRMSVREIQENLAKIQEALQNETRVNIILTDIDKADAGLLKDYESALDALTEILARLYKDGRTPQLNLLTDRLQLSSMNNCNAGYETITLAPDGKFYICPAFYLDGYSAVGDLDTGLSIPNGQLYRPDYAPICSNCDAYQCHRCIWLNRKTTHEVNTPGREQCLVAHTEREASRKLLLRLQSLGMFATAPEINQTEEYDPFEKIRR